MEGIWTPRRIFISLTASFIFMVILTLSGYSWFVGLAFGLGVVTGAVLASLRP